MIPLILFGSNNPSGAAFLEQNKGRSLETWGRHESLCQRVPHIFCDLSRLPPPKLKPLRGILISFAPIWLLAPFLQQVSTHHPELLVDLKGVIACSSSSFMTKRFAFNKHDKRLAALLNEAHFSLIETCVKLSVPVQILAPTLVYGSISCFKDKNISKIIQLMSSLPAILLPRSSGLRQPIHATQLAAVANHQASKMVSSQWSHKEDVILALGGDEILSYEQMILKIRDKLDDRDSARRCRVIKIPDRIFHFLACPLILIDPKLFESVMRISSNLSGFSRVSDIIGSKSIEFPILPLPMGD